MTLPRKQLVSIESTPYYHCVSRCVRRAFLCGKDPVTGKNFNHRRTWLENRMLSLAKHFCIQVAAYAVMSNHYHIILKVNKETAIHLSPEDVIKRWHGIFKGNQLSRQYLEHPESLSVPEKTQLFKQVEVWRGRLYDISWFMRCLNEYMAKRANQKDNCTGRFWEGRFKSQALLDNKALIACMAYVDLNPVRAGISNQPTNSSFTSIKKRNDLRKKKPQKVEGIKNILIPFTDDRESHSKNNEPLPFELDEYKKLLRWTVKNVHKTKPNQKSKTQIGNEQFSKKDLEELTQNFEKHFKSLVGSKSSYLKKYHAFKFKHKVGILNCEKFFS
jgi:putative transposase